ncbi:MAG: hypothetical protein HQM09_05180 [Candidatus Riflebacteria bacterium]|nr:hypothetical protein [Candidatus Riflebacteria bacterium]
MLERIDRLVFYFTVECSVCHNHMKVSHVCIGEQCGQMICTLCGKPMKVPEHEKLVQTSQVLNEYLGARDNAKCIKLTMNEFFKLEDAVPAAGH